MRKLGDQWVEVIDGKKHMLKAVPPLSIYDGKSINGRTCHGCSFVDEWDDDCTLKNPPCRISEHKAGPFIIKDLGVLNDDGLLPCPFCGEYPALKEELDENDERIYAVEHECNICMTTGWNHDRQTVIDACNRRA